MTAKTAQQARDQQTSRFQRMSREEQLASVQTKIDAFQQHQAQMAEVMQATGSNSELGNALDISQVKLSEVRGHQQAMNESIAELIVQLDAATAGLEGSFETMQQKTLGEKFVGFLSSTKSDAMRESRIRNADISDNLNNLLVKSDVIAKMLQDQLEVIVEQKGVVQTSLTDVLGERTKVLGEKQAITGKLDAMTPIINAITEQIANEVDPARRAELQTEYERQAADFNELKNQEQEKLALSQTLEEHVETYKIYLGSLQDQEGTQRVLLNTIRTHTRERMKEFQALLDSLRTANQQEIAHRIQDIGRATDMKGRTMMAAIGAGTKRRMASSLDAHATNMQQAADVQAQKAAADADFETVYAKIMAQHDAASYQG